MIDVLLAHKAETGGAQAPAVSCWSCAFVTLLWQGSGNKRVTHALMVDYEAQRGLGEKQIGSRKQLRCTIPVQGELEIGFGLGGPPRGRRAQGREDL